jgi:GlpG protein
MRLIGHLTEENAARTFGDFLYVQGIENQLDHQKGDGWAVWILDEDKIRGAVDLLSAFRANPADPKFIPRDVSERRQHEEAEKKAYEKKIKTRRHLFRPLTPYGFGPLTFALIVMSAAVFMLTTYGENRDILGRLLISETLPGSSSAAQMLPEVFRGEFWRLITPIFVHFGVFHLVFNVFCLRDLGSMVEGRQSSLHLLGLVVVIGVLSNLAQLVLTHNPAFGGMSGVVYGLLGYIWVRGRLDPASGLFLHSYTVLLMMIWFALGFTPLLPGIANMCHAGGLVTGMACGFFSSLRYR